MPTIVLKRNRIEALSATLKSIEHASPLPEHKEAIREWLVLLGYAKHYNHFSVSIENGPTVHTENSG